MVPFDITLSHSKVVARHLGDVGGPGGADDKVLKDWCTRFSAELGYLREELD